MFVSSLIHQRFLIKRQLKDSIMIEGSTSVRPKYFFASFKLKKGDNARQVGKVTIEQD